MVTETIVILGSIFLIDHAWTFELEHARKHLMFIPGLLDRMLNLMGCVPVGVATDNLGDEGSACVQCDTSNDRNLSKLGCSNGQMLEVPSEQPTVEKQIDTVMETIWRYHV